VIRYQITDGSAALDERAWLGRLRGDADFIQIREPDVGTRQLARLVRSAMKWGPAILVNDRTDVAIACGAAGVHLRSGSIAPSAIRKIAPAGFVISVACHNDEDVKGAGGANYIVLAPIFQPLSKAPARSPLGLEALRQIASRTRVPVIALGGVTESNATQCIVAGAAGVAGITLFRAGQPRRSG
jgi:thiamine-phosphate diphosphorylase